MSPNSSSPCELSFYHLVFVMKMICDLECLSIVDVWRQHIFSLDLQQPQTTRRSPRTVSNFFAGYYTKPRLRLHELDSNTFYKIHFHNENQLIETESSSQGGLVTIFDTLFFWSYSIYKSFSLWKQRNTILIMQIILLMVGDKCGD